MFTSIIAVLAVLCGPSAPAPQPGEAGWRFGHGNVCVLDQTKLSDGVWRAAVAWSKADDINLIWSRNCSNYPQAQTVTVTTGRWDNSDGVCDHTQIWTNRGYLKPGIITRAAVQLNLSCNTYAVEDRANLAAKAFGKAVGLAELPAGSPSSVLSSAWMPTDRDYQLVEKIYPW